MIKQKTFWISYDLGIKGDYPGLYTWLDNQHAKECGDSLAVFHRKLTPNIDTVNTIVSQIESEISAQVKMLETARIYLIFKEDKTELVKGKFLFGGRKRAPWEGYGKYASIKEEEDY